MMINSCALYVAPYLLWREDHYLASLARAGRVNSGRRALACTLLRPTLMTNTVGAKAANGARATLANAYSRCAGREDPAGQRARCTAVKAASKARSFVHRRCHYGVRRRWTGALVAIFGSS